MAVNLSKNGAALMAAYKEVVDGKSETNWALFTYEGNSNDIRLAEKGDGGLEEMVEELSSGKVMYAFCRVQDPNSGLPKYVLINWTGEGVKDIRKGICANHVTSMATFLRGAHVTVNGRTEDDVEPEAILRKVAKASGANFNFHKQPQHYRDVPAGTVGSVYQKVNAVAEIQQTNKENFWNQAERDEKVRRQEETSRVQREKGMLERERRELDDRRERERREKERSQQIERERIDRNQREEEDRQRQQQRQGALVTVDARTERGDMPLGSVGSVYQKVNAVAEIKQIDKENFWNQAERDEKARRQEEARRVQQEKERMERERRDMEEKQTSERERRAKERAQQIERERISESQREEEERQRQQQQQQNLQENTNMWTGINVVASVKKANEAKSLIAQRSSNPRDLFQNWERRTEANGGGGGASSPSASQPGRLQSPFVSQTPSGREGPLYPPGFSMTPLSPASPAAPVLSYSPVPAADAIYSEGEEWSDEFEDYSNEDNPAAAEIPAREDIYEDVQPAGTKQEDIYESVHASSAEDNTETNICVRALYDYQAADDTEITFDPDDIITGVEMLDEGWWRGYGPDGRNGMFPANFVELI
ncbi:drebrin-like protein B isoform X2 [Brachionichthys hirsutus]|uniref:drebrin-like protein B isoform X2 n=1 Tax=Brachionichthys hirsutus TaxID=412623 RepID=UPI003604BCC1